MEFKFDQSERFASFDARPMNIRSFEPIRAHAQSGAGSAVGGKCGCLISVVVRTHIVYGGKKAAAAASGFALNFMIFYV